MKPRDLERITLVMAAFELLWMACPDMRFGQLVSCVVGDGDIVEIEEDELLVKIKQFKAQYGNN